MAILQIIFVVGGLWMVLYPETFVYHLLPSKAFVWVIGMVTSVYFGFVFFLSLSIYTRKIALIITNEGIIDYSSFIRNGLIPWEHIKEISQTYEGSVFMIKIGLFDPDFIIEKEHNFIKRFLLKKQNRKFGSPVIIPMVALNSYVDTLERQLKERWELYRQTQQHNG